MLGTGATMLGAMLDTTSTMLGTIPTVLGTNLGDGTGHQPMLTRLAYFGASSCDLLWGHPHKHPRERQSSHRRRKTKGNLIDGSPEQSCQPAPPK